MLGHMQEMLVRSAMAAYDIAQVSFPKDLTRDITCLLLGHSFEGPTLRETRNHNKTRRHKGKRGESICEIDRQGII